MNDDKKNQLKREIWCKDCETVMGEMIEEEDTSFTIKPYLTLYARNNLIDCPNCKNVVDLRKNESMLGQLRLF